MNQFNTFMSPQLALVVTWQARIDFKKVDDNEFPTQLTAPAVSKGCTKWMRT
jgi:hypothetical protein